jgi:hypothetical protein
VSEPGQEKPEGARIIGMLEFDESDPNTFVKRDEAGDVVAVYFLGPPPTGEEPGPLPEGWKEIGYTTEGGAVWIAPAGTPPPPTDAGMPRCQGYVKGADNIERRCFRGIGHSGRHM